jgi:phosphatidylinositol-3-phosphatase
VTEPAASRDACAACAAPLAHDQRYCLECGARRAGPRRDALALLGSAERPVDAAGGRGRVRGGGPPPGLERRRRAAMPVALATLVALVVVAGTRAPETFAGGLMSGLTVVLPAVAPAPPPDTGTADVTEPPADVPTFNAQEPSTPPATPPGDTTTDPGTDTTPSPPDTTPPIDHVYVVMLAQTDVAALARDAASAPYLAGTLAKKGTLLTGYQTIAQGELANEVALLSGQGPTRQSLADCPTYADVTPDQLGADSQQLGDGCVFPPEAGTIADELHGAGKTWRAYVEDETAGGAPGCRRPALGGPDTLRDPRPGDAYATRRNPFVYFHSLTDGSDCAKDDAGLDRLDADLALGSKAPALSYIAPNLCHDGRVTPCAPGAPAGAAAADAFLKTVVPKILASKAYADGGLVVITSDGAPVPVAPAPAAPAPPPATTTPTVPTTTQTTPTTPAPPTATTPTTTSTTPTNPSASPTTALAASPAAVAARAAAVDRSAAPGRHRASLAAPPAAVAARAAAVGRRAAHGHHRVRHAHAAGAGAPCCGLTTFPNVGDAAAAGAGQRIGALLISDSVAAGKATATPANPFTLLRTLEDLFQLQPLGYAGASGVTALPQQVLPSAPS